MSGTDPEPDPEEDAETDPGPERTAEDEGGPPGPPEDDSATRGTTGSGVEGSSADPMALYGRIRSVGGRIRSVGGRLVESYTAIVVVAIVVGVVLAPIVAAVATQGSSGTVAVIPLEGGIDGESAAALAGALERARSDPDIDAVVIRINSGGGGVAASETMYFEIAETAEQMPVASSVDAIAASGAYYAAVGSDRIFVKPGSLVGSVGVLFTPPPELEPNDLILSTGPSKLTGASERGWRYNVEMTKRAFLSAVVEERGEALAIPPERIATARLFGGQEAVQTGMADEIGASRDAIEYAAAQAGLDSYDVTVLRPQSNTRFIARSAYLASDAPNRTMVSARYFIGEEGNNQYPNALLIPRGIVAEELVERSDGRKGPSANGTDRPGTTGSSANGTDRPGTTPAAAVGSETRVNDGY